MEYNFGFMNNCLTTTPCCKKCKNKEKKCEVEKCRTCIPLCKSLEEQQKHIEYTVSLIDKYIAQLNTYIDLGAPCGSDPPTVACQIIQSLQTIVQNLTAHLNNLNTTYQATLVQVCNINN